MEEQYIKMAKFLGWAEDNGSFDTPFSHIVETSIGDMYLNTWEPSEMLFDKSWDWLMLVMDRIEALGYGIHTFRGDIFIKENNTISAKTLYMNKTPLPDKKKTYFEVVSVFITWYNQQQK